MARSSIKVQTEGAAVPLLAAEPQLYPADLFDLHQDEEDQQWWVLHTKPRCEKTLARILLQSQISYFLPQEECRRKRQGGTVSSHLPLFPGYLFLFGSEEARLVALQTNKVVSTLPVDDQSQLQNELRALHQVIGSGQHVRAEAQIEQGSRVEVVQGVLDGLRGTVSRRDGSSRVFVEVKMLGRGVSVQVEDWMLQKI